MNNLVTIQSNWEFVTTPIGRHAFDAIREFAKRNNKEFSNEQEYSVNLIRIDYKAGQFYYQFEVNEK